MCSKTNHKSRNFACDAVGFNCSCLTLSWAFVIQYNLWSGGCEILCTLLVLFQTLIMVVVLLPFAILSAHSVYGIIDPAVRCEFELPRAYKKQHYNFFFFFFFLKQGFGQPTDNGSTLTKFTCLHYSFDVGLREGKEKKKWNKKHYKDPNIFLLQHLLLGW